MCGRLTQYRSWQEMREYYELVGPAQNLEPNYNVAPTTMVGVLRMADGGLEHVSMRWSLVPAWWRKPLKELPATFNARAEGIAARPLFRDAFRERRCVVWADGFYEWRRDGKSRTPFHITRADGAPLSLAGLWERWWDRDAGAPLLSCTIVTCAANRPMRALHDRMPVVLAKDFIENWLNGRSGEEILAPCADDVLAWHEVSAYVNNSRHEGPECIAPVGS